MKKAAVLAAVSLAVTLCSVDSATASILETTGTFGNNVYQIWSNSGINWNDANAEATSQIFNGQSGHLATITSLAEDTFLETLRNSVTVSPPELWVGGFQQPGSPEPGDGWMWVNGDGPIDPTNLGPNYANWLGGEPNDLGGEDFLAIGLSGQFGWNDEQALGNIGGFVVEYDNAAIPEPTTLIVWCLLGLCGTGVIWRRPH
jgi:hypothetical protein